MVATVQSIVQLKSYAGAARTLIVKDPIRGGLFNFSLDDLPADDGIIFEAEGIEEGYWVRVNNDSDVIFPLWYEGSDTERIQKAVDTASLSGFKVEISPNLASGNVWMIDEAILLHSNNTIIINNTKLKLSDTSRDNLFRTSNCGVGITEPWLNPLKNITIKGIGEAIFEGADNPRATGYNNRTLGINTIVETTTTYGTDALNPEEKQTGDWRSTMAIFAFTDNVQISGISVKNAHGFGISFERCTNSFQRDINYDCPRDRVIDGNNQRVWNCDGSKINMGGSFIEFSGITGHTDDNTMTIGILGPGHAAAGTESPGSLTGNVCTGQIYNAEYDDVHDVTFKNFKGWSYSSILRILNTFGSNVYNITIDDIQDASIESELTREITGGALVLGSFSVLYGGVTPFGSCSNISINNVKMRNSRYGIRIEGSLSESNITNFIKEVDNEYPAIYIHPSSTGTRNVEVSNIYNSGEDIWVSGVLNEYDYSGTKEVITSTGVSKQQMILTGESGTANINIDGTDYLATFATNLATTANNFESAHAATILSAEGVTVTANSGSQVLTFEHPTTAFPTIVINNVTGDLSGNSSEVFPITTTESTFYDQNEVGISYPDGSTYTYGDKTLIPKEVLDDAIAAVEATIPTVDAVPTDGSTSAVSSNGVFDALSLKQALMNGTGVPFFTGTSFAFSGTGNSANFINGLGIQTNLATYVRSSVFLTGLSITNSAVVAADSVLQAFGKLQGQIDAISDGNLSKTANYTIATADFGKNGHATVFVDATAGAVQIELPTAASMVGKTVNVIKTDASANAVTVKGNGSTNINGANTYVISAQFDNVAVKSNGTQYYIFG